MKEIIVKLFGEEMGLLFEHDDEIHFKYYDSFLSKKTEPSPIHLSTGNRVYKFSYREYDKGLPGLFLDSLPDNFGNSVMNLYLQSKGLTTKDLSPLEKLAYIGDRGMGALSYEPSIFRPSNQDKEISIETLGNICQLIKENRAQKELSLDEIANIEDVMKISSSVGGAKAKALIYRKDNHIVSGLSAPREGYQYEILKISSDTEDGTLDDGKIEYIYYKIATASKITMMPSTLLEHKGIHHFATQRFDIDENGKRTHTHTLAGLENINIRITNRSLEQTLHLIRKLPTLTTVQANVAEKRQREEMFRRMVFNIIADNRDDHSKNTSFLMNKEGEWRLSPAYDLMFSHFTIPTRFTGILGKKNNITEKDIIKTGELFDINKPGQIVEEIRDHFTTFEKQATEKEVETNLVKKIIEKTNAIYHKMKVKQNYKLNP